MINSKDISNAPVTLGSPMSHTGKEQTQEVKSVVVDGITVDSYTVSDNKAVGTHTLKITGAGNFTGTVNKDYVILANKAEQLKENLDGKIVYGKGTITITTNGSGSLVTSKTELVEMLIEDGSFTIEELEDIYNGDNVDISLSITDVSNTVSSDIKISLQKTAKKNELTIGNQYLDISLYKNSEAIHIV